MHYRPDIDGLRGFAIAAVVLFHAGLGPFPGGFVGVDIFFVISGYLITGLIVEHLRGGEFSFWQFYARRTRRIYPALFVLLPIVLLLGYFLLTPGQYEELGMSAIFSSAFLANVYFWLNTGYFDQSAETMPLLHIWSIAVEEQFYLVWPLTLVLVWRYVRLGPRATLAALVAMTVLLGLLCVALTAYDAKSAFYLPFARLWEFTLGALLLALPELRHARRADALSVAGMVAMISAVLVFEADRLSYPGYAAALPCLGAAAVIAAGERSLAGRFLSLAPNVLLGKVSYSLYLWHWPIIVFYTAYAGTELSVGTKLSLIVTALAISVLSWRFIEMPARRRRDHPRRHVALGGMVAATAAALSLVVVVNAGFPGRIPEDMRALGSSDAMMAFTCTEEIALPGARGGRRCVVGARWANAAKRAVLWGDSHGQHLLPVLDVAARQQNLAIAYWEGCPPFIDDEAMQGTRRGNPRYSENCAQSRRDVLDWIGKTPGIDLIILANAWAVYPEALYADGTLERSDPAKALKLIEQGLAQTLAEIDPQRHPVLILGDVPRPGFSVAECAMQSALWRKQCRRFREFFTERERAAGRPTEAILARLAEATSQVYFIDSMKAMCASAQGCPIRVGNEIIYRDANHLRHDLSLAARQKLAAMLGLDAALSEATSGDREPSRDAAAAKRGPTP